ncbi:MAG: hypothetical protein AAFY36_00960 [Bacteroidota bacterium]
MSNRAWRNSLIRFVIIWLFQAFIFKQVSWGPGQEDILFVFVYPVFILMMPLGAFEPFIILGGFLMGLTVDAAYDTLGLHAAAATFTAFMRPRVFSWFRPPKGYNPKFSPVPRDLGWSWFVQCLLAILAINLFTFFLVQIFAPQFLGRVLIKTVLSLIPSFLFVILGVVILNPRA